MAFFYQHLDNGAGKRSADFTHVAFFCFFAGNSGSLGVAVLDFDFTWQAVEFEEDGTHTGSIGFGDVVQLDNEHFALFNLNLDNLARSHAEEEGRSIENGYIAELVVTVYPVGEYLRIEAVSAHCFVRGRCFQLFELSTYILKIYRRQYCARTLADRCTSFEYQLLQLFGEALVWSADASFEEFHNGGREVQNIALSVNVFFRQVVLHHEECHITDNLGGRSNLD